MVQIKAIDKFGEVLIGTDIIYHNISQNPERDFVVACLKVENKFGGGGYSLIPLLDIKKLIIDGEEFVKSEI